MGFYDSFYYFVKMCNDFFQMLLVDVLVGIYIYIIGGVMWNCFVVYCCMMDGCFGVLYSVNRISDLK